MSAGLDASIVTPGITAPVASFTTPAMAPVWADATAGANRSNASAATVILTDVFGFNGFS
jgi:hypothetical protein